MRDQKKLIIQRPNETKTWFLEKQNSFCQTHKKGIKYGINKTKDKKGDIITDIAEIQKITKNILKKCSSINWKL
jgi:hypothetical protein